MAYWKCVGCGAHSPDKLRSCNCGTDLLYNRDNKKEVINKMKSCKNHKNRPVRENLDGDDLCIECCIEWAKGEAEANG